MFKRFAGTGDREVGDRTAKTCMLLPDALPPQDQPRLMELMDQALHGSGPAARVMRLLNLDPAEGNMRYFQLGKGIAEYRAGHFDEAARWLSRARSGMDGGEGTGEAEADLFLAMALQKSGRPAEAGEPLGRATRAMDATFPRPGVGDLGTWPQDWLICQIIRREAERLIDLGGTKTTAASGR